MPAQFALIDIKTLNGAAPVVRARETQASQWTAPVLAARDAGTPFAIDLGTDRANVRKISLAVHSLARSHGFALKSVLFQLPDGRYAIKFSKATPDEAKATAERNKAAKAARDAKAKPDASKPAPVAVG